MATLTSTEAGASGRYIQYDQAALDDLGSQTIIAYAKPTGSGGGGFGYLYGKTPTGSVGGPRFFVNHNGGSPILTFGASSTGDVGLPTATSTAAVTYSTWQHYTATWDGTLNGTGINLYVEGTDVRDTTTAGSTSVEADAANPVFIMNRFGLGRELVGDLAWVAVWDRVLNSTERNTAITTGPLDVPTGLVLLFANDADLSANAFSQVGRSTRVTGSTPGNTALGGSVDNTIAVPLGALSLTGFAPTVTASGSQSIAVPAGTLTLTGYAPTVAAGTFTISAAYERSSVNTSTSSVTGTGDSAVIAIAPRVQESEAYNDESRWLEPSARIDGVAGYRPTFRFSGYTDPAASNGYHGAPWQAGRRPRFSYDRETWTAFDTAVTVGASTIEFRHSAAFSGNTVYITRSRQVSVEQMGAWLAALAVSYPSLIAPAASALAYTPVGVTGYSGQAFIAAAYSAQTDELGGTVPATPLYAAEINDTSLMPGGGAAKRLAIITAGAHAGEDHGDFVMQRFVEYTLGETTNARLLRRYFRILIYPLVNAPGRAGGGQRGSFTQGTAGADDANRHFHETDSALEIVDKPKTAITTDRASVAPAWSIDFHGTYLNKWATFEDVGVASSITFNATLEALAGYVIEDEGDSNIGFISEYMRNLGASPAVTHEAGEPTPTTDGELTAHAGYLAAALVSLKVTENLVEVPAATLTLAGYAPQIISTGPNTISVPAGSLVLTGQTPTVSSAAAGAWTPVSPASGSWSAISPSSGTWTAQ